MSQQNSGSFPFTQLVAMFATSTLQNLGKLVNPVTHQTEINLASAQATIDLLDMLETKTKGNLDEGEEAMLRDTLTSLKLNYVETAKIAGNKPPEAGKTEAAQKQPLTEEPAAKPGDDKQPKFHKKYD